ncbi:MAG: MerR family transcriptional regulator [Symploca sp. SIO1A3]|nr:MerR family transcriptional regulator [Symploca sp. SIO1A3]
MRFFTREETAALLGLGIQQFDHYRREFSLEPIRCGTNRSVYNENMISEAKIAMSLRNRNISKAYIRKFLSALNRSVEELTDLFIVKTTFELDLKTELPQIDSSRYLLTQEEINTVIPSLLQVLPSYGESTQLDIKLLMKPAEILKQLKEDIEYLYGSFTDRISIKD